MIQSGTVAEFAAYDLKPCPHCGGPVEMALVERTSPAHFRICCKNCPIWTEGVAALHESLWELIIEAWNRRATS